MPPIFMLFSIIFWGCESNVAEKSPVYLLSHQNYMFAVARNVRTYAKAHNFNDSLALLIDLGRPSGHPRAVLFDLQTNLPLDSGLVAHGRCNQYWLQGRKYGNEVGCGCSSLGKYKIGNAYTGRFGKAYKLHGLESTNSNAFARNVVLHAHECIPSKPTSDEICQSDGCPTLAPEYLNRLNVVIKKSRRPMLLLIYDSRL